MASYYFGLFKKLQVFDHVPKAVPTVHGASPPTGGMNLNDPQMLFGASNRGNLLGTTPADSPIWRILDARATGTPPFGTVTVGSVDWLAMPPQFLPAWVDFQDTPTAFKALDELAAWITAGKVNDVPTDAIMAQPATFTPTTSGLEPFVCSYATDQGDRGPPSPVPNNFWSTSLIYLVSPATGLNVNPPELAAAAIYNLVAVIGNKGDTGGGRYYASGTNAATPDGEVVEAKAWVMVWNTSMSPAVQLPAASNMDPNDTNGVYDQFFLRPGEYDVAGWKLEVQTVFDGLVKAIDDAGVPLGGLTAEEWVKAEGAHLCAKVVIRKASGSWPATNTSPKDSWQIAQRNLKPLADDLAVSSTDPNILWNYFMSGDMFFFMAPPPGGGEEGKGDERWGKNKLIIDDAELRKQGIRLYLAIPRESVKRWLWRTPLRKLKRLDEKAAARLKNPFPEGDIYVLPKGATVEFPRLGQEFLAMAIGIQYSKRRMTAGKVGDLTITQTTTVPKVDPKKQCYELVEKIAGGFTIEFTMFDSRKPPRKTKPKKPPRKGAARKKPANASKKRRR